MGSTLLDLIGSDTRLKRVSSTKGGEYAGQCPWCGGNDRFRVWPDAEHPGYWCRGCARTGDAIDYLRQYRHMTYQQAQVFLGQAPEPKPRRGPTSKQTNGTPNSTWQSVGQDLIERASRYLWTDNGIHALAYLYGRGLVDETIKAARIGFIPKDHRDKPEYWGLTPYDTKAVFIPRGIIIPWQAKGHLWNIRIRRANGPWGRYHAIAGSSNGLYGADNVIYQHPVVITEGEFDALVLQQEISNMAAVVATGSTAGSRLPQWTELLSQASLALVAYDADTSGEKQSAYWTSTLGQAKRWRPYWGDVNDIALEGFDLKEWVKLGLYGLEAA